MTMRRVALLFLLVSACAGSAPEVPVSSDKPAPSPHVPARFQGKIGQTVTVSGVAQRAKAGLLLLIGNSETLWLEVPDDLPNEVIGTLIEATGTLVVREDLPVFERREGEPERAGIPVEPGTDVRAASRRVVLTGVRWRRVD